MEHFISKLKKWRQTIKGRPLALLTLIAFTGLEIPQGAF